MISAATISQHAWQYRYFAFFSAFFCLLLLADSAAGAELRFGTMKADRILFFGNSITISPVPVPETNWPGGWGMAASAPDKDYVHLLVDAISETAGATPEFMATYNCDFEVNFATYDFGSADIQTQLAFEPDIVVVAIGENVPDLDTQEKRTQYAATFGNLLNMFKSNGNPEVFVRSCFWVDETKDDIMREAALAAGCVFVDQSKIGVEANWAMNEPDNPFRNTGHGVNMHPGDAGMKAIADSLYDAMEARAAPEPSTIGMLGIAGSLWAAVSLFPRYSGRFPHNWNNAGGWDIIHLRSGGRCHEKD